ncbi:MAG: putative zinc-binding metallopeptidase [Gammaproteobacteria bacterium]
MKRFSCSCGVRVFFDDYWCTACGADLGYAPQLETFLGRRPGEGQPFLDADGAAWKACRSRTEHAVCNWLLPAADSQHFCASCRLNSLVPNLDTEHNVRQWRRLEHAKRRLIYSLLQFELPMETSPGRPPLRFAFLEDQRSNPQVAESLVMTGHQAGIITINLLEADDVARHAVREQMSERYRTLLGHFRHESGHYYQDLLAPEGPAKEEFRVLFGDERQDYAAALARYHETGPAPDWGRRHISTYASSHPMEDWAECWSHYLHITDGLETARATRFVSEPPSTDWNSEVSLWISVSVRLNELARGLGVDDPYPFVLNDPVLAKLAFIHRRRVATRPDAVATAATR